MTIFEKHFILDVSQGYEYASEKTKQNFGALLFISQNFRTTISANSFHFLIQFYLHIIILRWDIINHTFSTYVFHFKLIHQSSWIHTILIRLCLPVQTHPNNYRPTFSNSLNESKEIQSKLRSIVLTLWQWVWSTVSRCYIVLLLTLIDLY